MTEQILSLEAEEALIGSILITPYLYKSLDIKPADFFIQRHRWIWEAFERLTFAETAIDIVTVAEDLQTHDKLTELGGAAALAKLINNTVTTSNAGEYARIVKDKAMRRGLVNLSRNIAQAAYDDKQDINETQSKFLSALVKDTRVTGGAEPVAGWMESTLDLVTENAKNPNTLSGMQTGYIDFDNLLGGVELDRMYLLGGKPGQGKSIWVMNISKNLAANGNAGALYSPEMSREDLGLRMLSAASGTRVSDMRRGVVEDWAPLYSGVEQVAGLPLYVSDSGHWTVSSLRADLTRLQAEHDIKWFVFDYLSLLRDKYGNSEYERAQYLSRNLRLICRDLGLGGIIVQSMTKAGFEGAPRMENMAGGAGMLHDADTIMFMSEHIPDMGEEDPSMRTITIRKGRHMEDPRRYFYLYKHSDKPLFENATQQKVNFSENGGRNAELPF